MGSYIGSIVVHAHYEAEPGRGFSEIPPGSILTGRIYTIGDYPFNVWTDEGRLLGHPFAAGSPGELPKWSVASPLELLARAADGCADDANQDNRL